MSVEYTKEELDEFRYLVMQAESQDQMERIEARFNQPKFIEKHGREKCDAMYQVLLKELEDDDK